MKRPARRFAFLLAMTLGCTVRELLQRIDSRELSEWQAYFRIEPWGQGRDDLRAGTIAAVTANCHSTDRTFIASDFLPTPADLQPAEPKDAEALKLAAIQLTAMLGGRVK